MIASALPIFAGIALLVLGLLFLRLLLGPTFLDRLATFEALVTCSLCLVALLALRFGTVYFFEVVIVLSIVGFLSTLGLARYYERGDLTDD